jgi:hypothetical protein
MRTSRSAQKAWSPANGTTTDGTPARQAEWLVPEPPWCTTVATRAKSQSCGTSCTTWKFGGSALASIPLQPGWNNARRPAAASMIRDSIGCASKPCMLPNPK